jgi:hypothetical protein
MCMLVNWTVGKRSRVVYRRRRDEALAWQLRVLFALSRCQRARTSSHAKLHLHDFEERASSFRKEERRRNIFSNSQLEPIMATSVDDSKVCKALSLLQSDC